MMTKYCSMKSKYHGRDFYTVLLINMDMQFGIAYGREFDRKNRNSMGVVIPSRVAEVTFDPGPIRAQAQNKPT